MPPLPRRLAAWLEHWQSLKGDRRVPLRESFEPADVPALLPHINLLRWEDPGRLLFRLNGTAEERRIGQSVVGANYLDSLHSEHAGVIRAGLYEWSLWPTGLLIDADEIRSDGQMHQTIALTLPLVSREKKAFLLTVVSADPDPAYLPEWGSGGWRDQIVGLKLLDVGAGLPPSWSKVAPGGVLGRLRRALRYA